MKEEIYRIYISTILAFGTLYCVFIVPNEFRVLYDASFFSSHLYAFLSWLIMFFATMLSISICNTMFNLYKGTENV